MTIALYAFSELDGSMIALTSINEFLVTVHALNKQHCNPDGKNLCRNLKRHETSSPMTSHLSSWMGDNRLDQV
jgi:hypothetical protein